MIRNILGDRAIEWGFIKSHIPPVSSGRCPAQCLDFGPGGSTLSTNARYAGYSVTAVDLDNVDWHPQPGVTFIHSDIFKARLPHDHFDLVINCSTIEHVGISGRYGVTEDFPDGDLEAMALLWLVMKPGAKMLLTIPLGQDAVFTPLCRVYGEQRLPQLLSDFTIDLERYWIKDETNAWMLVDRTSALAEVAHVDSWTPAENLYALGCFVLRRPE